MRTHQLLFVGIPLILSTIGSVSLPLSSTLYAQEAEAKTPQPPPSRFSSPLRRAVQRGLAEGGDIVKELQELEDFTISVRRDAEAIINALSTLTVEQLVQRREENQNVSALEELTSWFDECDDEFGLAHKTFEEKGIPQLIKVYDAVIALNQKENEDDLANILRVFARYQSKEGASRIIEAARRPIAPDSYLWYSIFLSLSKENPHGDFVLRAIRAPLPDERIARQLLGSANQMMLQDELNEHPFNTPAGQKQLESWLTNLSAESSEEDVSNAIDATVALAFVASENRERLLKLALENPNKKIQLEAAWAAAKSDYSFGLDALVALCKDLHYSANAKDYLEEIEKKDAIPAEALEPNFAAKAEFSQWLQHPNELGEIPDELEIVDHRELPWPPTGDMTKVWLIRYLQKDKTGLSPDNVDIGFVGGMTWCFFVYDLMRRPVEDAYAIHAYFEMQNQELIQDAPEEELLDLDRWLPQWKGEPLTDVELQSVIEASTELNLRNHSLALATAKRNGEKGWVVFDGPRTMWYPQADQPGDEEGDYLDSAILMIHVGRQLLGFPLEVTDRQKYLANGPKPRAPEEIINAYEKLLAEVPTAKPERQQELLESYGPLSQHFDDYVNALITTKGVKKEDVVVSLYESLLAMVDKLEGEPKLESSDAFSAIGSQFEAYAKILIDRNRQADVLSLIQRFEPLWDYNYGYATLGTMAYKAGDVAKAEQLLTKILEDEENSGYFIEEITTLAEIWKNKGDVNRGQKILIDGLEAIKKDISRTADYPSSQEEYVENYKQTYAAFLKLYPDDESKLKDRGFLADPIKKK